MTVEKEDLILGKEFQDAMDTGRPQPSWGDIKSRASRSFLPRPRRRREFVLVTAVAVLAAGCGASIVARTVYFKSAPRPSRWVSDAFARIVGPPGAPANKPVVVSEPRRVLTLPLSNGATAALWAAPTLDGNYCFDTQVVSGDPNSLGARPAWGTGLGLTENPGCGEHNAALDVGYDIRATPGRPPIVLVLGGSGLRAANSVEVRYEDGSSTSVPAVHISPPVGAALFMFQIPVDHTKPGSRPIELILRARDNSVLARDEETFSGLWRLNSAGSTGLLSVRPNSPGYRVRKPDYAFQGGGIS
jgi:hypothetical protein